MTKNNIYTQQNAEQKLNEEHVTEETGGPEYVRGERERERERKGGDSFREIG